MKAFSKFVFDLQMFAVQTTLLNSPGNDLSPEMKTYYDMTLIDYAQANLVHDQFGQKRPIPKGSGKTIEFRAFSPLEKALVPLTEGVTPSGNKLDVTRITATVAQYGDFITQSDVLELTAIDNTVLEATKILGRQAGLTLDTVTREKLMEGTNVNYAAKLSGGSETDILTRSGLDTGCQLTVHEIQKAVAKLEAQNAPKIGGYYVGILHPYAAYSLMRDPEWKDWHEYTNSENMYANEVGEIAGVRFVKSTEAKIFKGANLASDSETLTINNASGYSGAITSVAFDGGTVAASALVGRWIQINGVAAKVTANTNSTITFESTNFGSITDNTKIYPGEGGKGNLAVFATLIIGDGAYGVTEIEGGGLETIVKQKGSAGTADPLDQKSSVGWKAIKTAEILIDSYMVRIESVVDKYSASVNAN